MRFVVCIKEVPDTTEVRMDPENNTLIRDGVPSIINPFDAFALELALSKKDKSPEIEVITLSMGPPHAEKSLRETIAMGADRAVLVSDRAFAGSDTWATSRTLSAAIKKIGDVDLVLAGQQAIDGDTAQVGPGIAEFLGWPQGIFIRDFKISADGAVEIERITDTGYEELELGLPAVLSVIKLPKDPRLPSLRGMMKSKKADIPVLTVKDLDLDERELGLDGSPTRVYKIFTPPKREGGEMWRDDPQEMAAKLADMLKEKHLA
jgi:electron transfer flavoprotein beta subunit